MYYTKGVWNRLLGILLLLCLGTMAPAQKKSVLPKGGKAKGDPPKVALIWGDTFQIPNHYTSLALLRIPGKGLVEVFNRDLKSFLLKKHEGHAKMPEMNNITLDFLPAATTSELFVTLRGHIYWLYSYWEKESSIERICARELDVQHLTFGEQKVVLQFQNKISSGAKPLLHDDASLALTRIQGYTARKYQFTVNTDSSRLSIQYTLKSVAKDVDKAPDVLSIHTFDEHLVSIHRDQYTMPYNRERMEIADYRLDTANKPCFLARVFDNPKPVTGSEGKYHLEAFHFQPGDAVPKIILVGAEGMNTQSLRLFQDKQGRMFCAGTYSHTEGTGEEGFCMLKLDLENNTALPYGQGIYPFPAEQKSVSDKAHVPAKPRANQAEPVKLPLSLLGLCFHPNGTITVAGEEQGITQTEIPGKKGKTETQNTYHYGTIVLMQLDPGGNMKWLKRIPKLQNGKEEEGEMSCAVGMSGNETVVVYVDDPKNLKLRSNQPPAAFADGSSASLLYMYIDALGKETRGALFDAKLKKLLVYPARFRQLSPVRMAGEAIGPEAETSFYVGINE